MKYKFGPVFVAGILAMSSGVSHAADRAQEQDQTLYVKIKIAEGMASVAAIGVGQQRARELEDERTEYRHRIEANDYSLRKMHDSDEPLKEWFENRNLESRRWHEREEVLSADISKASRTLGIISKTDDPVKYAKLEKEIRSLKGELAKVDMELGIVSRRIQAVIRFLETGQGEIQLTHEERKLVSSYNAMKRAMIAENKELMKKTAQSELKSLATLVAYVPGVIVAGTTVADLVATSKRMEKAQASSQQMASPAVHSENVTSEAAR